MNKVAVNNTQHFDIDVIDDVLMVNGNTLAIDQLTIAENSSHFLHHHKSYNVELVELDSTEKTAKIKVNGTIYEVKVTTALDLLLKQLGMDNLSANKVVQLKAPMPGLVLNILVKEGDEIKKGDSLLVLEAMKMENIIKAPADAVVKKIEVTKGDKIEKNTILIKFE